MQRAEMMPGRGALDSKNLRPIIAVNAPAITDIQKRRGIQVS